MRFTVVNLVPCCSVSSFSSFRALQFHCNYYLFPRLFRVLLHYFFFLFRFVSVLSAYHLSLSWLFILFVLLFFFIYIYICTSSFPFLLPIFISCYFSFSNFFLSFRLKQKLTLNCYFFISNFLKYSIM